MPAGLPELGTEAAEAVAASSSELLERRDQPVADERGEVVLDESLRGIELATRRQLRRRFERARDLALGDAGDPRHGADAARSGMRGTERSKVPRDPRDIAVARLRRRAVAREGDERLFLEGGQAADRALSLYRRTYGPLKLGDVAPERHQVGDAHPREDQGEGDEREDDDLRRGRYPPSHSVGLPGGFWGDPPVLTIGGRASHSLHSVHRQRKRRTETPGVIRSLRGV